MRLFLPRLPRLPYPAEERRITIVNSESSFLLTT